MTVEALGSHIATKGRKDADRLWLTQLVAQAQARSFYGRITITLKAGQIERVAKEETFIPPAAEKNS